MLLRLRSSTVRVRHDSVYWKGEMDEMPFPARRSVFKLFICMRKERSLTPRSERSRSVVSVWMVKVWAGMEYTRSECTMLQPGRYWRSLS